jgi:hypothetical protein
VGDPEAISYEFQVLLDMNYAVGRLAFDDPDGYLRYVDSLIAYETAATTPNSREVLYWGTKNRDDQSTRLSAECLVRPLYEGTPATADQPAMKAIAGERKFRSSCLLEAAATRANLLERLHAPERDKRPAFLLTASHGVGFPRGHERQRADQGALVCQDWPGRRTPPQPEHLLRAEDLHDEARLHGLVAFLFACYGAGTPAHDQFLADRSQGPRAIADQAFVAALPQRLLSHQGGGALAVFGHVERGWSYSIRPPRLGARIRPFRNLLSRVLKGEPVGHATKDISDRFTATSSQLSVMLGPSRPGPEPDPDELASLWIECNDARNFILLGDPAARLRTDVLS